MLFGLDIQGIRLDCHLDYWCLGASISRCTRSPPNGLCVGTVLGVQRAVVNAKLIVKTPMFGNQWGMQDSRVERLLVTYLRSKLLSRCATTLANSGVSYHRARLMVITPSASCANAAGKPSSHWNASSKTILKRLVISLIYERMRVLTLSSALSSLS